MINEVAILDSAGAVESGEQVALASYNRARVTLPLIDPLFEADVTLHANAAVVFGAR